MDIFIIMFLVKGDELDKIFGLNLGGDDYVIKLFFLGEILVRVKVILRRIKIEV